MFQKIFNTNNPEINFRKNKLTILKIIWVQLKIMEVHEKKKRLYTN